MSTTGISVSKSHREIGSGAWVYVVVEVWRGLVTNVQCFNDEGRAKAHADRCRKGLDDQADEIHLSEVIVQ